MADAESKRCLRALIDGAPVSLLVTNGLDGVPAIRPMQTVLVDEDFEVWFATGRSSNKCAQIQADPRVTVYWQQPDVWHYGEIVGSAEVVDTPEARHRFWQDEWTTYFPEGKDDPQYVLIRVTPRRAICHHMQDGSMRTIEF